MNAKQKGSRGERMLAQVMTDAGFPARRGQQFKGGKNSPDVVCPLLNRWHWESKFTEQLRLCDWLPQVEHDCGGKPWVIGWKRKFGPWLAIMKLDDLLDLIRESLPPQTSISIPLPASCDVGQPVASQTQKTTDNINETAMKLTEAFPSKWLKAADLEGQHRLVTIETVKLEAIEEGKPAKPVVTFRGMTQGLVLNKTNGNTIASFLGDDTDHWISKKIVLYPAQAEFQGHPTACIRVRQPKPQAAAPTAATTPLAAAQPNKTSAEIPADDDSNDVPF